MRNPDPAKLIGQSKDLPAVEFPLQNWKGFAGEWREVDFQPPPRYT